MIQSNIQLDWIQNRNRIGYDGLKSTGFKPTNTTKCFIVRRILHCEIFNVLNQPEGEAGEPYFRRLVLRSVAHIIRHYSSSLITESEVWPLFY